MFEQLSVGDILVRSDSLWPESVRGSRILIEEITGDNLIVNELDFKRIKDIYSLAKEISKWEYLALDAFTIIKNPNIKRKTHIPEWL